MEVSHFVLTYIFAMATHDAYLNGCCVNIVNVSIKRLSEILWKGFVSPLISVLLKACVQPYVNNLTVNWKCLILGKWVRFLARIGYAFSLDIHEKLI